MFETMKVAALLQKFAHGDPKTLPAMEAFELATRGGARALGIEAGTIRVGNLADLILVDPRRPELTPRHNDVSNWVYSAHGGVVDTTICDGVVLMRDGHVKGEADILQRAGDGVPARAGTLAPRAQAVRLNPKTEVRAPGRSVAQTNHGVRQDGHVHQQRPQRRPARLRR